MFDRELNAPLLLVLAKVFFFIKKEMICLIFAFIDNIFFSITQPSNMLTAESKIFRFREE